ncbi:MAG: hypothetical protein WAS73_15330 [Defluviicoccus sp.]
MSDEEQIRSALRDIVDYERQIGQLLNKINTYRGTIDGQSKHIQELETKCAKLFDGELFSFFIRSAEQQQRQIDRVNELVLRLLGNKETEPASPRAETAEKSAKDKSAKAPARNSTPEIAPEPITDKKELSKPAKAAALDQAASRLDRAARAIGKAAADGKPGKVEQCLRTISVDIADLTRFHPSRALIEKVVDADEKSATVLRVRDTAGHGLHGVTIPAGSVSASALRSAKLVLKDDGARYVRIRLRQKGSGGNNAVCSVDLRYGSVCKIASTRDDTSGEAQVRRLADRWFEITFLAPLQPSTETVELQIITLPKFNSKSSLKAGVAGRGFLIRSVSLAATNEPVAAVAATATVAEQTRVPAKAVSATTKAQRDEDRRQQNRKDYLESGAYDRIATLAGVHAGRRAFIIGNGPSINGQDLTLLQNEITFVTNWFVNHPRFTDINPAYYCVSSHEMFGGWNNPAPSANPDWLKAMTAFAGRSHKIFSFRFKDYIERSRIFPAGECDYLLFDRPKHLVDARGDINLDLSQPMDDGYTGIITFCLPLALHLGIREIYLVGCDCDYGLATPDAPKKYFYDYSRHTTSTTKYDSLKRIWADNGPIFQAYQVVSERFAAAGARIVNCTAAGRLEVFPRARYETVVGRNAIAA